MRWMSMLLFGLAVAHAQDSKIALSGGFPDKTRVRLTGIFEGDVVSKSAETKEYAVAVSIEEEFLQSREDGKMSLKCVKSVSKKDGVECKAAYEGKTFTITSNEKGERKVGDDGPARLGGWLDLVRLLPAKEVAVGDTWKVSLPLVDAALVAGVTIPEVEITCKLAEVKERIAKIELSGQATSDASVSKYEVKLLGELRLDIDKKRFVTYSLWGALWSAEELFQVEKDPMSQLEKKRKLGTIEVKSRKLESKMTFDYE